MKIIRGIAVLSCLMIAGAAHADCMKGNAGIPPGANTTDPSAPFYIDTSGLDFKTLPPTRDPKNPNYPSATELPDGTLPPIKAEGNFIIGPTHAPAPERPLKTARPTGKVYSFTMSSSDSTVFNPGLIRDDPDSCLNASVFTGADGARRQVEPSRPHRSRRDLDPVRRCLCSAWLRRGKRSSVHCRWRQRLPRRKAVLHRPRQSDPEASHAADRRNLIGAGGQDAQGSERGFEYDAVNGAYAEFVENEVLPLVESHANIKLTKNPEGRATMGISSSGSAAFTMAWFHPELYHRVLTYSPTVVNQQWPHNPALPGGAWEYHSAWAGPSVAALSVEGSKVTKSDSHLGSPLIPNSPTKPIRIWFETGDHDLFYPVTPVADGMHDWVLADERFAKALADKGYHYQFLFARNARTCG